MTIVPSCDADLATVHESQDVSTLPISTASVRIDMLHFQSCTPLRALLFTRAQHAFAGWSCSFVVLMFVVDDIVVEDVVEIVADDAVDYHNRILSASDLEFAA